MVAQSHVCVVPLVSEFWDVRCYKESLLMCINKPCSATEGSQRWPCLPLRSLVVKIVLSCCTAGVQSCNGHVRACGQLQKSDAACVLHAVLAGPLQTRVWRIFCVSSVGLVSGVVGRRDQYVLAVSLVEALKPEQFAFKEVARKLLFILFFHSAHESDPGGLKPLELFVIIK